MPLSFTINVDEVFKDKNGICWRYVGRFDSNYIAPPNVNVINYDGDYFVGSDARIYPDCTTCIETPLCDIPENLEPYKLCRDINGPLIPGIYQDFYLRPYSVVCDAWNWYYSNRLKLGAFNSTFIYMGTESLNVGNTVYGYNPVTGLFSCDKVPAGNYWLLNVNPTDISLSNPASPDITIVQINGDSVITNIIDCFYQP